MHSRLLKRSAATIVLGCVAVATSCGANGMTGADEGTAHDVVTAAAVTAPVTEPVTTAATTTTIPPDLEIALGSLTAQNWATYDYRTGPDTVTITAPDDLVDLNVRQVFWPVDRAPVPDDTVCTTWDTRLDSRGERPLQPGVAMRIASVGPDNQGIRAVTVTENVWWFGVWLFNVHIWNSLDPVPMTLLQTWDLSDVVAPGAGPLTDRDRNFIEPPWHLCGRTSGDTFSFKLWADTEAEPSWSDPTRVFTTPLPPGWDHAGYSGGYIGHMGAGRQVTAVFDFPS